jgi:hypothetical protein
MSFGAMRAIILFQLNTTSSIDANGAAGNDLAYMKPSFLLSTFGLCFALGIPLAFSQVNASEPRVVAEYKGGENPLEGSDTQWKNSGRITNWEAIN